MNMSQGSSQPKQNLILASGTALAREEKIIAGFSDVTMLLIGTTIIASLFFLFGKGDP